MFAQHAAVDREGRGGAAASSLYVVLDAALLIVELCTYGPAHDNISILSCFCFVFF